jgi:CHAT domain-containing protein/Tfp pilus assembly protein PilF
MEPAKGGICFFSFCCLLLLVPRSQTPSRQVAGTLGPGVVVEKVLQHSEAEKAGFQKGDVLVRWARGDVHGEIQSPFDLSAAEIEQAPRGNVLLEGLRGVEEKTWQLGQDRWGMQVRPNFPDAILTLYRTGEDLATAGKLSEAAEKWRLIFDQGDSSDRQWLLFYLAGFEADARHWQEADRWYQEALQLAAANLDVVVQIHIAWGRSFVRRNDWGHAGGHFDQAMVAARATGDNNLALAKVLDELGGLAEKQDDLKKAEGYYQQALRVRERLSPGSLSTATSVNNLGALAERRGDLDKAEELDERALAVAEKIAPGSLTVAQALGNLGDVSSGRGKLAKAEKYYRRSFDIYEALERDSLGIAVALERLGWVASRSGDLAKTEEYYRRALSIQEKAAPDGLDVARSLSALGLVALERGDPARGEAYFTEALTIEERLAPDSLDVVDSLENLSSVAWQRGDLARGGEYSGRALAILERWAPDSLDVASLLEHLAIVFWLRGDLAKAEEYYTKSLTIEERLAPVSLNVADTLTSLGTVIESRGDLAKAEDYQRQALAIRGKLAPGSLHVATSFTKLGDIASERGDLAKAEDYQRQALMIQEKLVPRSLEVAMSFNDLGDTARQRGDLARAEDYQRRGLAIRERLAPGSLAVASSLIDLGLTARKRGNGVVAEKDYSQSLRIFEKLAPVSVITALNLNLLAQLLESRGALDEAEQSYRKASAILDTLAPGSVNMADSLAGLASIRRRQGRLEEAAQFYAQALDAFEAQTARLGGSADIRADFRAKRGSYRESIDVLLAQGKPQAAFEVLERSRARILLEILASAHVDIRRGVSPELLKEERSLQADIKAKSERHVHLLSEKQSDEQIKAVEKEITTLTAEYQDVEAQIRSSSPAYAALTQPQPLSAKEIQQKLLDADTVLLEYSLEEQRSHVFVVSASSLEAFPLPKRAVIEAASRRVYELLTARNRRPKGEKPAERAARIARADSQFPEAAAQLSRMVLGPAAGTLANKRLLIVSDGALNYVPFAALPIEAPGQAPAPLVARHEIVNLPSASVLAVMRRERQGRPVAGKTVAVVADPVFSSGDVRVKQSRAADAQDADATRSTAELQAVHSAWLTRSAADLGWKRTHRGEVYLPRLPGTRREANAIVTMAATGKIFEALDFQANRATATSAELENYRIVHFATHALLNSKHPELSGLVLSLVNERGRSQSGFLGLEDIYNLNLPAELVVLSACETALGKDVAGEGMVGLTRGFMYAGASRVVASLWNINDQATAEQMRHFYRAMLGQGMRPAAALRTAQLKVRQDPRWNSPYFWAAFQIQGEWK